MRAAPRVRRRTDRALQRLTDLGYRAMDRMRHPKAFEAARAPGTAPDFSALSGARQCLVVSFKRSGEPVPTPVNFGLSAEGRLYFRSEPRSAKVRRIERDPHVRVAPCNLRAKPLGPMAEGRASVLAAAQAAHGERTLAANWSRPMTLLERALDRLAIEIAYIEIEPEPRARGEEAA